ncbi:MAG: adenylyl-sulfate kinase [Elusimicrobiota bacterium]
MTLSSHKKGIVYWFTGLAGAGKTTLGKLFYLELNKKNKSSVFLDGDELRDLFDQKSGYSVADRKKISFRNARLCKLLSDQGIDVVCATISMFKECQDWNRKNIARFKEIYIKASIEVLRGRDKKKIYSRSLRGKMKNVMGVDLPFDEPKNPDVIIISDGKRSPMKILQQDLLPLLSRLN